MKKVIAYIMVAILSLSMLGCGDNKSVKDSEEYQKLQQEYDKLKEEKSKNEESSETDQTVEENKDALKDMEQESNLPVKNIKQGDIIKLGSYKQDGAAVGVKEHIEWIVLSVDEAEGKALLLSKYVLNAMRYNESSDLDVRFPGWRDDNEKVSVTWQDCTLRTWLNEDFYNEAFNTDEKTCIEKSLLKNPDNPKYGTKGGNDTEDKVFLLSIEDVVNPKYGFSEEYSNNDEKRRCTASLSCASGMGEIRKVWTLSKNYVDKYGSQYGFDESEIGNCCWWLRSPGFDGYHSCAVDPAGRVIYLADEVGKSGMVNNDDWGIRPSVYINVNIYNKLDYAKDTSADK